MKKILSVLLVFILFMTISSFSSTNAVGIKTIRQEVREEVREGEDLKTTTTPGQLRGDDIDEVKPTGERPLGVINRLKNFVNKILKFNVRITGTLQGINGSVLTVLGNDGKTYTINVNSKTQLRRDFWGKSTLAEFSVGDKVNVIGKWTDDNQTAVNATLVRDTSIQKRWGVFFGKVTVKNGDSFVFQTINRGLQTVVFGSAKFIKRNETTMTYTELNIGDEVRVKGVWDKTLNKIESVDEVKDFSLPVKVKPTVSPAVSPTGI